MYQTLEVVTLVVALISAGYYSGPIFLSIERVWNLLVPCLFTIREKGVVFCS